MAATYTLVYDGDCRFCNRTVDIVRRWDRNGAIEPIPFQDAGIPARFPWIPASAYSEAMQLIGPNRATWQGAAAVEQLFVVLPRGRWIAWMFRIPLVRALADRMYRWIARNRYRLGCADHCTVESAQRQEAG